MDLMTKASRQPTLFLLKPASSEQDIINGELDIVLSYYETEQVHL